MYHRVPLSVTFSDGVSMANALTYKGVNGSMVSIRWNEENTFLTGLHVLLLCSSILSGFSPDGFRYWIGGSDEDVEGLSLLSPFGG